MTDDRWLRLRRWTAIIKLALALGGSLLFSLWLSVSCIPAWYDPPTVAEADLPRIRAAVPNAYQSFTDRVVNGAPFTFTLRAAELNEWIAARDALWPDARGTVPGWLHGPVIAFERDRIILAARVTSGSTNAVVSARFAITASADTVEIRLVGIAVGALPLPRSLLPNDFERQVRDWLDRANLPMDRPTTGDGDRAGLRPPLTDGIRIPNRFHWSNGRRDFRLVGITSRDGSVNLTVEPQ
ncbi:MAG: hypothetical protein HOP29_03975 [Phycisphaerales bacterium]|nr:hypothetical protein [Phycisphaerales bacterium]